MHFKYEITSDEYVAGQLLYYKLSSGRRRVERATTGFLLGLFFIVMACNERTINWPVFLIVATGAWWIYAGIASLAPTSYFRRAYPGLELAGKVFNVDLNEAGFEVTGDLCYWGVRWAGVRLKGEDDKIFMLCAEATIFIFGKTYLNGEQQRELRKLSGLEPSCEVTSI